VLQVCDVELQPGEQVNSIHLGDTVRWTVEPAITGYGPTEVQHLIVKPMDVNLDTTLLVTTNRRTYSLRLRSHRTQFMPKVSFAYPDEALRKWDEIKLRDRRNAPGRPSPNPRNTWATSISTTRLTAREAGSPSGSTMTA
jgi:type IV secretion system protein VirB9